MRLFNPDEKFHINSPFIKGFSVFLLTLMLEQSWVPHYQLWVIYDLFTSNRKRNAKISTLFMDNFSHLKAIFIFFSFTKLRWKEVKEKLLHKKKNHFSEKEKLQSTVIRFVCAVKFKTEKNIFLRCGKCLLIERDALRKSIR